MPGLVPGIHVFQNKQDEGVDGRDKPGHDDQWSPTLGNEDDSNIPIAFAA
jgi:hypothetical protein